MSFEPKEVMDRNLLVNHFAQNKKLASTAKVDDIDSVAKSSTIWMNKFVYTFIIIPFQISLQKEFTDIFPKFGEVGY